MMPNVRESKILDPTPWIPDSSICQWNLDFPGFGIVQAKISRILESGFHYMGRFNESLKNL